MPVQASIFIYRIDIWHIKRTVFAPVSPYEKIRSFRSWYNIQHLIIPVFVAIACRQKRKIILICCSRLCHCHQLVMLLGKFLYQLQLFFQLSHKYAIVSRFIIIHIKTYKVYVSVTRITLSIIIQCFGIAAWAIFVNEIMYIFGITQIFYCITIDIFTDLRVTECSSPPEPASGAFVERTE